ncbi:PorT family protein [Flavobacterium sp. LaA7.5]|nr:PorT family protein [Flavobacterium salilacus subsp. altitudinum]
MKNLFVMLLIMISTVSIAQITFQPGYYIDNNGNKTECLIRNVAWKNNPSEFDYKLNESDESQVKTIKEVTEFSVNESYKFKRFTVNIERSSTDVSKLTGDYEPQYVEETLFLKIMVEGTLNLYQYEDDNIIKYFYSKDKHENATQLLYMEVNNKGMIHKNNRYKQQLYNLMKDKISQESHYEKLNYNKNSLIKLFIEYNGNEDSKNFAARQNQGKIHIKITPGVNFAALSVDNPSGYAIDFDNKAALRIGAELEYILPFNNNKWSVFIEPAYNSYENDGSISDRKFSAKYHTLEVAVGPRHYLYLNPNTRLFIDAMFSFDFVAGDAEVLYNATVREGSSTSHIAAGAGIVSGRFSGEVRYNFSRNYLVKYQAWHTDFSSVSLILGIRVL